MNIPNGLICRYCGKNQFPHSLTSHEKGCRRKITTQVDLLFQQYHLKFAYPPEFQEWPLPPKIDRAYYNQHAIREYQATSQLCPRCGRGYPMIAIADHLSECNADPKTRPKTQARGLTQTLKSAEKTLRPDQQVQISQGPPPPVPQYYDAPIRPTGQKQVEDFESEQNDLPQGPKLTRAAPMGPETISEPDNRIECQKCHRLFAPNRIDAHERICKSVKFHVTQKGEHDDRDAIEKLTERNIKGFDAARYLPADAGFIPKKAAPSSKPGPSGKAMGMTTKAPPAVLNNTSKAATQGGKRKAPQDEFAAQILPDGRIACMKCGRGFAKDRIDKHQQVCTSLQNMQTEKVGTRVLSNQTATYGVRGAQGFKETPKVSQQPPTMQKTQAMTKTKPPSQATGFGQSAPAPKAAGQQIPAKVTGTSKFCHACGEKHADGARFCMSCGEKRQ